MAKVHQKIGTPPPFLLKPKSTTTTFLGCFRSSNKNNTKIGKSNRRSSWFSWSRFRSMKNKSAATKTVVVVPLDVSTLSDKQADRHRQPNNKTVKATYSPERSSVDNNKPKAKLGDHDDQLETKLVVTSAGTDDREPPGVLPLIAAVSSDKNPNRNNPSDALKDVVDTRQQRRTSFCQRIESIRTGGSRSNSQPGSPVQQREHKKKPVFTSTASAVVSPSSTAASTQPNPKRQKRGGGANIASSTRKTWFTSSERETARLDPSVGMTIIMVTLIIMVIWGRLCAILCTAAWFYLLPRLTRNTTSNLTSTTFTGGAGNAFPHPLDRHLVLDFESDEYKKRVVLDGFLKRNKHHNHVL